MPQKPVGASSQAEPDIIAVEVRGINPAILPLLEPRCIRISPESKEDAPGEEEASEESCRKNMVSTEVGRLLNACASVFSSWYLELQDVISRGRVFQEKYREEHKLHKNSKAPWKFPGTTEMNTTVVEAMQMAVRTLFCKEMAEYAMDCYERAIMTGDKRAFKIRLMFLRCRDSMRGHPLYEGFAAGVEEAINLAEAMAGCIPYGGPRRMSRAERAAKEKRELEKSSSSPSVDEKADMDAGMLADVLGDSGMDEVLPCEEDAEERPHAVTIQGEMEKEREAERPPEPTDYIDDELLKAEVAAGTMTPGRALILMMQHPAAPSSEPKKKPVSKMKGLDMDKLADEVIALEGGAKAALDDEDDENPGIERDDDDVEEDEDEDDSSSSPKKAEDDDDDDDYEDDPNRKKRRRRSYAELDFSYVGRERYRRDYGAYNASGSEWDPNSD